MVGELSLDGSVRHVRGVLPMAATAAPGGLQAHLRPPGGCRRGSPDPRPGSHPGRHPLADLYAHLTGAVPIAPQPPVTPEEIPSGCADRFPRDQGQEHVKRALEVAAAGGHNVLMVGPPGAGKTLLARAMPGILPRMTHRRSAGCDAHLLGGRPAAAGCAAHPHAPVPRPAPHHQPCRAGGRRQLAAPGRDLAGAPRRALPG